MYHVDRYQKASWLVVPADYGSAPFQQQAQGMVLKIRETLIGQRTALINTARGHAVEFGSIAGKGAAKIASLLSAIEQVAAIPPEAREMFVLLGQQIDEIDARIKEVDARLNTAHKANEVSHRLVTIPGVGPITALTLAVEIDPAMFESGVISPPGRG